MKLRQILVILVVSIFTISGLSAFGMNGGMGMGNKDMKGGMMQDRGFDITNLTDEQKEKIATIMNDNERAVNDLRVDARELQRKLHTLMTAEKLDVKAISAEKAKLDKIMTDIETKTFDSKLLCLQVLTADQRKQISEFDRPNPDRMMDGRGQARGKGKRF